MFRVRLTNFRCFAETSCLEVLPITFLVGENSAGKTTFLAAVRQLLESFIRSSQNTFNRDPYFLGGFDQIAHYRGGRGGRAKSFSIEIIVPPSANIVSRPPGPRSQRRTTETRHKFTFVKGAPQPELSEYEFGTPDVTITLDLSESDKDKIAVKVTPQMGESFQFSPTRSPLPGILRKDLSYIRFFFDELNFAKTLDSDKPDSMAKGIVMEGALAQFGASLRFLARRTFASAPVRTQPLRTYTPSEIAASSEGSHVPLEMARQKISSPTEWTGVHEQLAKFGTNSGLFDDIDIRLLGKRDGDPFQVVVRTKGPPVNLVDVGYGVSQALPIIYQLEQSRQHDAFLLQQPEVHLHPRAQAELGTLLSRLAHQRP